MRETVSQFGVEDDPMKWESVLAAEGMPAELPTVAQAAAAHNVEILPIEYAHDPEAIALAEKLQEEDPRNVFGGFPNNFSAAVNLAETLRMDWEQVGVPTSEIKIFVHSSCVNGHDCMTMYHAGGQVYHYNTRDIVHYSRDKMLESLRRNGFASVADKD